MLGFRSDQHAEAAALVPNAEVVHRADLRHRAAADRAGSRRARVRARADARGGAASSRRTRSSPGRRRWPAATAPATAARSRSTASPAAPLRRGAGLDARRVILNASGCLDALDGARGRARPRRVRDEDRHAAAARGQPPRADRRDRRRDAQLDRARQPGHRGASSPRRCPGSRELGVPLWVSVGGFAAADYAETCAAPRRAAEVTAIELNLSCPNVDEAPETAAEIVAACRAADRPAALREALARQLGLAETARAVEAAGADGLSLVNTIRGLALDERTLRPALGPAAGRLSGPALKPIALAAVYAVLPRPTSCRSSAWAGSRRAATRSSSSRPARRAVALGTVLFADPDAPGRVRASWPRSSPRGASRDAAERPASRTRQHHPLLPGRTTAANIAGQKAAPFDAARRGC